MRTIHSIFVTFIYSICCILSIHATTISDNRLISCLSIITDRQTPALSFHYGNETSQDIFRRSVYRQNISADKTGIEHIKTVYEDTISHLRCVIDAKCYSDIPAIEWTCYIENTGKDTTALIKDILAADIPIPFNGAKDDHYEFFYSLGSHDGFDDFALCDSIIHSTDSIHYATHAGRSSGSFLPFFNISRNKSEGIITSIGWTGQWKADFIASENTLQIKAGMEKTSLVLYPGEKIRTPMAFILFWKGKRIDGQNMLRHFIVEHASPKPFGKDLVIPVSFPSWGGMTTLHHLRNISIIQEKDLGYDNYWIDAGWFGGPHKTEEFQNHATEDWYGLVGDWRVNTLQHPNGLRPISDAAHSAGMRFLLWFEPERAVDGTPVVQEHPEWFIKLPNSFKRYDVGKWKKVESFLLNLGIPEARLWITQFISNHIREMNMDILRIDVNIGLANYWQAADPSNRIGMSEIRYVEGLYQFLDDLLTQFPHLIIDNCAGGGNRLDLEMLRRSVALHRSDYVCDPKAEAHGCQLQAFSIMHWIPYSNTGTSIHPYDTYRFRSNMNAGLNFNFLPTDEEGNYKDIPSDYPWEWFRMMMHQHAEIKKYYNGDYFPLTPFSKETNVWCAYQLYRKDVEEGFIIAFRRENAPPPKAITIFPDDIQENQCYYVTDMDTHKRYKYTGKVLKKKGLKITLNQPRSSALLKITMKPITP